ncbi:MAG: glycoside hydrolase family 127 protein [Clostridia bacterium]|nr:glycoside hydrolase family 127 protein [Clostridia bacterium]
MRKWNFYTSNQIKPQGWLREQLALQANGLCGNLDKVWPDVRDSAWIGGDREGWERVPYWLDGFIPLAFLLEDKDMISRAKRYIDKILENQQSDGWICPCKEEDRSSYDTWAVQLIAKVLTMWYECSGDERIPTAVYRVLRNYYDLLSSGSVSLFGWGKSRWYETCIAIRFLHERCHEEWLSELVKLLRNQGTDFDRYLPMFAAPLEHVRSQESHVVNLAMQLKSEAVSCDFLKEDYRNLAETRYRILMENNGMPVGTFTGDEHLSGLSPVQGTELCGVVELMYSFEHLYAYTGDPIWAERLEQVAFNALSATISDDMWAHQYDQQSNQICCSRFTDNPIWRTNGREAGLFGLEPNYGCCTADHGQGWPKFALSAYMHKAGEIINVLPVPSRLDCEQAEISLTTEYPFRTKFVYEINVKQDFVFRIRIPSFAKNVRWNGKTKRTKEIVLFLKAGEHHCCSLEYTIAPRMESRPYRLKTVRYGSLVFSLPIRYEAKRLEYESKGVERKYPYCDYEYLPLSDWNYGFSSKQIEIVERKREDIPFSSQNPSLVLKAKVRKIPWGHHPRYHTVCAVEPLARSPEGKEEVVSLYPYGCAKLRMTELPLLKNKK